MGRVDFTPAVILVVLTIGVALLYYAGKNPALLKNFNTSINNLINQLFAVPPSTGIQPAPATTPAPVQQPAQQVPSTSCNNTATLGCCTDNANNTCWRGNTTSGIKVGGCIQQPMGEDSCDDARNDFIDQFGADTEEEEDNKDDNNNKSSGGDGKGTTPSAIGPTRVNQGGRTQTPVNRNCSQLTGETRKACEAARGSVARRVFTARRPRIGIAHAFGVMNV